MANTSTAYFSNRELRLGAWLPAVVKCHPQSYMCTYLASVRLVALNSLANDDTQLHLLPAWHFI